VQRFTKTHVYLYALIGIVVCVVIGYLVSLLRPATSNVTSAPPVAAKGIP